MNSIKKFSGFVVLAVFISPISSVAPLVAHAAIPQATVLIESFGIGSTASNIQNWHEQGNGTQARAFVNPPHHGTSNDTVSPDGGRFAYIEGDGGWICRTIDATGFESLKLSYVWRGDSDSSQTSDDGVVEYKTHGGCDNSDNNNNDHDEHGHDNDHNSNNWVTLKTHDMRSDSSWTTQSPFSLPTQLKNRSFLIRFRADTNRSDEGFRVDGINVTGTEIVTDTTAPTATVAYDITTLTNQNVTATITPSETVTVTNNGGSTSYVFTANGSFTFEFADTAGNTGSVTATVSNIDKEAPVIHLNGSGSVSLHTSDAAYSDEGATATDNVDVSVVVTVSGDSVSNAVGSYQIKYDAVDVAGNHADQVVRTIDVSDASAPVISTPSAITIEAANASGATVSYDQPTATDDTDETTSVICTPASGSVFAIGVTTVECTSTDTTGNIGSASFNVTVQDTTAPVISAHDNITVDATSVSGVVVEYTLPSVTDSVDSEISASCTQASGTLFSAGTTTVTCNASDSQENSATPTTFVVTVNPLVDNEPQTCSEGFHLVENTCVPNQSEGPGDEGPSDTGTTTPATPPTEETSSRSGGHRRGDSTTSHSGGRVLGATSCGLYLKDYMKEGAKNDPDQVKLLQVFLNEYLGTDLAITGVYGPETTAAVKKFQLMFKDDVLKPWVDAGLSKSANSATGYVYKTTLYKINHLICPTFDEAFPILN